MWIPISSLSTVICDHYLQQCSINLQSALCNKPEKYGTTW